MLKRKSFDYIVIIGIIIAIIVAVFSLKAEELGIESVHTTPEYEERLFDDSYVHQIDVIIDEDDWSDMMENPLEEEYHLADLVIDGDVVSEVGIRTKGNNSLRLSEKYGTDRFSLKVEMDHYGTNHYYGLDKFSLDSSFQDNSFLKSYMAYDMMRFMGVPSPLTAYTWVTVNGRPYGLFLAVEEIEEAFALRNYDKDYGKLYKPGYRSLDDENRDVKLQYIDDDPDSYPGIFENAKFDVSESDQKRVINALKILESKENLDTVVDVDQVLRYFVPQVFVVNLDGYLGPTAHNYFLYEEDGRISMLPWDYNLAFATYSLGMRDPINDAELYVNYPIDTPASGDIMLNRPLYHHLMLNDQYFNQYHVYFDHFISEYFESGHFLKTAEEISTMIEPYVNKDPTAYITFEDYLLGRETFIDFNLSRAQSIRGQLDGTIPSTINGQNQDDSQLIDASDIWLPDMGEVADLKD